MPRKNFVPSYRLHKGSGQAVVTLAGRDIYLGKHGTPESLLAYQRTIAEWTANGGIVRPRSSVGTTVDQIIEAYVVYATGYYVKNGTQTNQMERIRRSLRPVHSLYGTSMACEFGPLKLKAIREQMISSDWTRGHINQCVGCIKRMFKWATSEELLPATVHQSLATVEGLQRGRCKARESAKVLPVPEPDLQPVLDLLAPITRAMASLQLLTGMRPGEVCNLRPCDINRSGPVWTYTPVQHKTEHHDYIRIIYIGPKAQAVLEPYLDRPASSYCFSAREVSEEWLRLHGRTVVYGRSRTPGEKYQVTSYCRAVAKACRRAKVKRWHPHQLRHNAASRVRAFAGPDAARAFLGQTSLRSTEIYAELDMVTVADIASKIG